MPCVALLLAGAGHGVEAVAGARCAKGQLLQNAALFLRRTVDWGWYRSGRSCTGSSGNSSGSGGSSSDRLGLESQGLVDGFAEVPRFFVVRMAQPGAHHLRKLRVPVYRQTRVRRVYNNTRVTHRSGTDRNGARSAVNFCTAWRVLSPKKKSSSEILVGSVSLRFTCAMRAGHSGYDLSLP
jgi:hypothetical protein